MDVITVQRDFLGRTEVETTHLRQGATLTFGRGAADSPVDLPLLDPAVSRQAGIVRAVRDYWEISNLSSKYSYVVENTTLTYPLDPAAKHFLVLIALCEAQLKDPSCDLVPTVPEIQQRLAFIGLSRSAINYHVDFLATVKFRLQPPGQGPGVEWKARAIVRHALQFGLVTLGQLDRLMVE